MMVATQNIDSLTWCMLILTTFPKGCPHFCWQGFKLLVVIFWGENKLTLLYKLHTDYFSLCQSVILSVLSHEEIYLNICGNVRGVLTFVIQLYIIYIYIYNIYIYIQIKFPYSTYIYVLCVYIKRIFYIPIYVTGSIYYIYCIYTLQLSGAFNKFPDFFVQASKFVIDSWKFTMLLLYILWDDWPISMISGSNEWLQQQLEYTLLKPDCQIWTWGHFRRTICNKIVF